MDWFRAAYEATFVVADQQIYWREVIGNVFGLASALGGLRRKVWAWPVGVVGNILLFTVFMGSWFGETSRADMLGQAGRQIMFIAVSVYGWYRWRQTRKVGGVGTVAVHPTWASWRTRLGLVAAMVVGTLALTPLFRALGSYEPVWADAWIFMGSVLATYGMAKGWVEFWLIWVAVDLVGVPLLFSAGYWATALMYVIYGAFTLFGFFAWWHISRRETAAAQLAAAA